MNRAWDPDDFPDYMHCRDDCGPAWEQIGPANWQMKWKGDPEILAEIAYRRFGPRMKHSVGAVAVRVDEYVQVSILFRDPETSA